MCEMVSNLCSLLRLCSALLCISERLAIRTDKLPSTLHTWQTHARTLSLSQRHMWERMGRTWSEQRKDTRSEKGSRIEEGLRLFHLEVSRTRFLTRGSDETFLWWVSFLCSRVLRTGKPVQFGHVARSAARWREQRKGRGKTQQKNCIAKKIICKHGGKSHRKWKFGANACPNTDGQNPFSKQSKIKQEALLSQKPVYMHKRSRNKY